MQNSGPISDQAYWDSVHRRNGGHQSSHTVLLSNECLVPPHQELFQLIKQTFPGGKILEVGAGNSRWLPMFATALINEGCVGLDYSEVGCESLKCKAELTGVSIDVVCADLFMPPQELLMSFDFVFTYGVVEHFNDLPGVLRALKKYLKPGGVLFTVIPNLNGVFGWLTKRWNRTVYDLHKVYDLDLFKEGHIAAGLEVSHAVYVGLNNFYMLSSCFPGRWKHGANYLVYGLLTRISRLTWWLKSKFGVEARWRSLAPYIVVVSGNCEREGGV